MGGKWKTNTSLGMWDLKTLQANKKQRGLCKWLQTPDWLVLLSCNVQILPSWLWMPTASTPTCICLRETGQLRWRVNLRTTQSTRTDLTTGSRSEQLTAPFSCFYFILYSSWFPWKRKKEINAKRQNQISHQFCCSTILFNQPHNVENIMLII